MALKTQLLRDSFNLVRPQSEQLAETFYATLFERYPQVKPLFKNTDLKTQGKKLVQSLAFTVDNLEHPDKLTAALHELGARHVAYGTQDAHYPAVGECLLLALSKIAGPAWTPELNTAWGEAYQAVADFMIEGARAAAQT